MVTIEAKEDYVLLTLEDGIERKVVDKRTMSFKPEARLPPHTLASIICNIFQHGRVEYEQVDAGGTRWHSAPPDIYEVTTYYEGELSTTGILDSDYEHYHILLGELR